MYHGPGRPELRQLLATALADARQEQTRRAFFVCDALAAHRRYTQHRDEFTQLDAHCAALRQRWDDFTENAT